MKCVAVALAVATPALGQHATGKTKVNDADHLRRVHAAEKDWVPGHNEFFGEMTFDDARAMLGTELTHISEHMNATLGASAYSHIKDESIPSDFDSRKQWPGLIHDIRNQEQCGSCWAFSASEVLSDRVSIATGKKSPVLSPEDMVSCDKGDMGCQGGMLPRAWDYLTKTGIVTDTCFPYAAGGGQAPTCPSKCVDSESWTKTKAAKSYAINGESNMQKEIMTNGPIQVAFKVYKSFMSYKGGVYHKLFYEFLPEGGHAVKIVGWGVDNGKKYWTVANSWGTTWGEDGFFRILRGSDHCGIETLGPPYAGSYAADSFVVV